MIILILLKMNYKKIIIKIILNRKEKEKKRKSEN